MWPNTHKTVGKHNFEHANRIAENQARMNEQTNIAIKQKAIER